MPAGLGHLAAARTTARLNLVSSRLFPLPAPLRGAAQSPAAAEGAAPAVQRVQAVRHLTQVVWPECSGSASPELRPAEAYLQGFDPGELQQELREVRPELEAGLGQRPAGQAAALAAATPAGGAIRSRVLPPAPPSPAMQQYQAQQYQSQHLYQQLRSPNQQQQQQAYQHPQQQQYQQQYRQQYQQQGDQQFQGRVMRPAYQHQPPGQPALLDCCDPSQGTAPPAQQQQQQQQQSVLGKRPPEDAAALAAAGDGGPEAKASNRGAASRLRARLQQRKPPPVAEAASAAGAAAQEEEPAQAQQRAEEEEEAEEEAAPPCIQRIRAAAAAAAGGAAAGASGQPEVVFLGTGSAEPSKYRGASAIHVRLGCGQSLMLDCGEGAVGALVRLGGWAEAMAQVASLGCLWVSHRHAGEREGGREGRSRCLLRWRSCSEAPFLQLLSLTAAPTCGGADHMSGVPGLLAAYPASLPPLLVVGPRSLGAWLEEVGPRLGLRYSFVHCLDANLPGARCSGVPPQRSRGPPRPPWSLRCAALGPCRKRS